MASTIQVDKIQDTGGNTILSSNSTGTFTYEAASGANFTALDADNVSAGTLAAARGGTGTTSYTAGVTEYDQWRTTTETAGSQTPVDNWARVADASFEKIGTGMSESSGVFTFPSTGKWWIATFVMISKNGDSRYNDWQIQHSGNSGVSWDSTIYCSQLVQQTNSAGGMGSMSGNQLMDITDASTARLRATFGDGGNSTTLVGASATTNVSIAFMRIGDT